MGLPPNKKRNFTPLAWNVICLPKERGGISLRRMFEINQALIAKLGWTFFNSPESLWVQLCKSKYPNQNPIVPSSASSFGSCIWKGIMKVSPQLQSRLCLLPRNGSAVNLREDPWLLGGLCCKPNWRDGMLNDHFVLMVSDLVAPNSQSWNEHLLRRLFSDITVGRILRLPIPR